MRFKVLHSNLIFLFFDTNNFKFMQSKFIKIFNFFQYVKSLVSTYEMCTRMVLFLSVLFLYALSFIYAFLFYLLFMSVDMVRDCHTIHVLVWPYSDLFLRQTMLLPSVLGEAKYLP